MDQAFVAWVPWSLRQLIHGTMHHVQEARSQQRMPFLRLAIVLQAMVADVVICGMVIVEAQIGEPIVDRIPESQWHVLSRTK